MLRKILSVVGWGLAGLVVALGLTAGAFALAGQSLDEPLEPPVFPETSQRSDDPTPADDGSGSPQAERSDSPSPSVDDHGGDGDNPGSEDGDNSGPGSDSDNSGSGSDNSGSGSDNSGSGSDNSGSGSGDDHDDD